MLTVQGKNCLPLEMRRRRIGRLSSCRKIKRNAKRLVLQEQVQPLRLVVQCCSYIYNQPEGFAFILRVIRLISIAILSYNMAAAEPARFVRRSRK